VGGKKNAPQIQPEGGVSNGLVRRPREKEKKTGVLLPKHGVWKRGPVKKKWGGTTENIWEGKKKTWLCLNRVRKGGARKGTHGPLC